MNKYPIVEVTWEDHRGHSDAVELEDIADLCVIQSVGYLVKTTKRTVSLSQELHDDGMFRDVTTIAKVNVKKIKTIRK